jgi:Domain of unknown function (DUF4145)
MNATCPHCLHKAHFNVVAQQTYADELHQIQLCQACERLVFRLLGNGPGTPVRAQWPLEGIRSPHSAVPAPIGADWYEAHLCQSIRAFRAAAAMARRAVQGVTIEQGAKGSTLNAQLKDLEAKATLHPTLIEWADHIRLLGNSGAHPGADGLETVTEEEAAEVVRFLDELLRWLYELPAETAAARAARSTLAAGASTP